MINYTFISEEEKAMRLDKYIAEQIEELSRTQIQQLIKEELITVNGKVMKTNYKVHKEDVIVVNIPEPEPLDVEAQEMDLTIVYEDEDLLIVNKPTGMVVHPAKGHMSDTLVNGLLAHCQDLSGINGVLRPGIVHRLDKDTSGLLVVAKNDQAHQKLSEQFAERTVLREYIAVVHGHIAHNHGTIDAPIGRDERERQNMAISDSGKPAITHFEVVERLGHYTVVKCRLETGRTHQIRVHMQFIKHPLVGDPKYGLKKEVREDGQVLHAMTIGFIHPTTGEVMQFTSEPPTEFQQLVDDLRITVDKE